MFGSLVIGRLLEQKNVSNSYVTCLLHLIISLLTQLYILPVVLNGCETWSLTLREKHRLRVFENRVLSKIFGPKRHAVTGEWRKFNNEELRNLYSCPSTIIRIIKPRRMRWAGEKRNAYRLFVGKPEGKRPTRKTKTWVDG
jgi:hypothetical protein